MKKDEPVMDAVLARARAYCEQARGCRCQCTHPILTAKAQVRLAPLLVIQRPLPPRDRYWPQGVPRRDMHYL